MNGESVSYYIYTKDNLDIVNNKYVIASIMVGGVITINLDLNSYNNMFYKYVKSSRLFIIYCKLHFDSNFGNRLV